MPELSKTQKKKLQDAFGEQSWETADGTTVKLKHMDLSHLSNTIKYIQRRTQSILERQIASERSLKMELASLMSTRDELVFMRSPGVALVDESIAQVKEKLNSGFTVPQAAIDKELAGDFIYQCMLQELKHRNQVSLNSQVISEDSFLESKLDVVVMNIKKNPKGIPLVVEVSGKASTINQVKVGDYLHNSILDVFRITYLVKRTPTDKDDVKMEITLNARTEHDKEFVMSQILIGEHFKLY